MDAKVFHAPTVWIDEVVKERLTTKYFGQQRLLQVDDRFLNRK